MSHIGFWCQTESTRRRINFEVHFLFFNRRECQESWLLQKVQAAGKMGPGIARLSKDEKWFSSRARGCWPCLDGAAEASSPGSDLVHGDLAATWGSDYFPMVLFGGPTKPKLYINSKILVCTILQQHLQPKRSVASSNWVGIFSGNHILCIEHIVPKNIPVKLDPKQNLENVIHWTEFFDPSITLFCSRYWKNLLKNPISSN